MQVTAARRCAFAVVRRVFEQDAYADRGFRSEADRLELRGRDRALAMHIAYGTVQRRATLDYMIERFTQREPGALDGPVVAGLRIGLYQLAFMERVPAHAAVSESVELVKQARSRGHGLVNAALRRGTREARDLVMALDDQTPEQAALAHSHPLWIVRLWWDHLGPAQARALLARDNQPAESAVRANTLVTDADQVVRRLHDEQVSARTDALVDEAVVVEDQFDAHGSNLFESGALMPQSRAAMLVTELLDPQPGERVLDLCAAPGAKTTHIAARMRNEGEVVAVERDPVRAESISQNVGRLGVTSVRLEIADATEITYREEFDRVLVDPPCSDLGTLQSRPDVRWRKSPEQVAELAAIQARILDRAVDALKPGGRLTYSTCTISPSENATQIGALLARNQHLLAETNPERYSKLGADNDHRFVQTLPSRDHTDGFFIATLRKQK